MELPAGFRDALRSTSLPLEIDLLNEAAMAEARKWPGMPPYYIPFAGDGGGNYWCFDTRLCDGGEYSIEFWDHEQPDAHLADGPPTRVGESFAEWLDERIREERRRRERASFEELCEALAARLAPHLPRIAVYTPNADEVLEAERALPFALPKQYRWFTGALGAVSWPVIIVDALDLDGDRDGASYIWFGRDQGRRFGFDERGAVVEESDGTTRVVAGSFFAWIDAEISRREADDARRAAVESPRVIKRERKR